MIVGKREESVIEQNDRHLKELKEDVVHTKYELEKAEREKREEDAAQMRLAINLYEKKIAELQKFHDEYYK